MSPFMILSHEVPVVKILFRGVDSAKLGEVLKICENYSTFSTENSGENINHSVVVPLTEIVEIVKIVEIVCDWDGSELFINNEAANFDLFTVDELVCFHNRQKNEKPEEWCFDKGGERNNIWGCVQLQMPLIEDGADWLNFGRFDKAGVWYFDKKSIKKALDGNMKKIKLCPVFKSRNPIEELERFPDYVNPKYDKSWSYSIPESTIEGEKKTIPIGVKPQFRKGEGFVLNNGYQNLSFSDFSEDSSSIKSNDFLSQEEKDEKSGIKTPDNKFGIWFLLLWIVVLTIGILIVTK